jgi:hypothetical protein
MAERFSVQRSIVGVPSRTGGVEDLATVEQVDCDRTEVVKCDEEFVEEEVKRDSIVRRFECWRQT